MAVLGLRNIKRHIRGISDIRQITRAMELVASVKMRKARELLGKTRPHFQSIEDVINDIIIYIKEDESRKKKRKVGHELMEAREVKKACYIIVSADRGLAGSYNVNIIRMAQSHMDKQAGEVSVITIGQKARDYFRKRDYEIDGEFTQISEDPTYASAKSIAKLCIEMYIQGSVDEVYLVYTEFLSAVSYNPKLTKLLPLEPKIKESVEDKPQTVKFMLYEPSVEEVLNYLIPKYIESMIYGALVESATSEQSARRVAMKNATDNAGEIIDDLQLKYHRARQASITQEISEIVSGAEALS
ncbi:MAG: ATP synthase F1 subunit gamma [Clostridiales bacterium]|nr:ATP synthase F1 subunit gamma [Clostridiales bacterium]